MSFCGQCGLHLPPGSTACPRCGLPTEPEIAFEDADEDEPTLAAHSIDITDKLGPDYQGTYTQFPVSQQQPLILRPGGDEYYSGQQAVDESFRMPNRYTPIPPVYSEMGTSYPNDIEPDSTNYPFEGTVYPDYAPQGNIDYQEMPAQATKRRGRTGILLLILFVLLALLGIVGFFVFQNKTFIQNNTQSPSQQADAVITQYYTDVNQKNYQEAYNLWATGPLNYNQFVNGYKNTQHDDISLDNTTSLNDGTYKIDITIHATEAQGSGTVVSVYSGSYIVGKQNGVWKILRGNLNKIG